MKLTQIATLLNNTLVPNVFGDGTSGATIAEDLRNVVDLGTALSGMDGDTLKNYAKDFAVGVIKNYFDVRSYTASTYGIFIDSKEYGGAIQRTKAKLLKAYDTPILSLENYNADSSAPDYLDGKYYGAETTSTLYTKDVAKMIPYSIPVEMFKKSFMSADDVQKFVAFIETVANNTMELELNTLAKGILRKLALSCNTSRKINLISAYNTEFGYASGSAGEITLTNWKQSTAFKLWCEEVVIRLKKSITEWNDKYNDATVPTFTPESDTRVVLLEEFATALDFAQSSVYHKELTDVGEYSTIVSWQNGSTSLLNYMKSGSVHDEIVEVTADSPAQPTTISHVAGLIFSNKACGITTGLANGGNKATAQYVAKGDFTTVFNHMVSSYWIDTAESAIMLCMA